MGSVYEVFRLLHERGLGDPDPAFALIFSDLELLRIPIEKHEIAKDKKHLVEPLTMVRLPSNDPGSDSYVYDAHDKLKAHIMPAGLSSRNGSMIWQAIDLKTQSAKWIDRQQLSDRIIRLWAPEK